MIYNFSNFTITSNLTTNPNTNSGAISAPSTFDWVIDTDHVISGTTFTDLQFYIYPAHFALATQNAPNLIPSLNYFEHFDPSTALSTDYEMSWVNDNNKRPGRCFINFTNNSGKLRIRVKYYYIASFDFNGYVQNTIYDNKNRLLKDNKNNSLVLDNSISDVYSGIRYIKNALYIKELSSNDTSKYEAILYYTQFRFYNRDVNNNAPKYLAQIGNNGGFEIYDGINQINFFDTNLITIRIRHKVEQLPNLFPCLNWETYTSVYFYLINVTNNNNSLYFIDNYDLKHVEAQTGTTPLSTNWNLGTGSFQAPYTSLNNYTGTYWDVSCHLDPSTLNVGDKYRLIAVYQIDDNCPFIPLEHAFVGTHFFSFISDEIEANPTPTQTDDCVSIIESSLSNYNYKFGDWIEISPLQRLNSKVILDISNYLDLPTFISGITLDFIDLSDNTILDSATINWTNTVNTLSFEYEFRVEDFWKLKQIRLRYTINHDLSIIQINQQIDVSDYDPEPGGFVNTTITDFTDTSLDFICSDNPDLRFCITQLYSNTPIIDDRVISFLKVNNDVIEDDPYPSTLVLQQTSPDFISNPTSIVANSHCIDINPDLNIGDNIIVSTAKAGGGYAIFLDASKKNMIELTHKDHYFTGYNATTHSVWAWIPSFVGTTDIYLFSKEANNQGRTSGESCLNCNPIGAFGNTGTRPKIYMKILNTTGEVEVGWEYGSTLRCITRSTNPIPTGQWVNITWVRTGHNVIDQRIYINAVLEVNVSIADDFTNANQITFDEITNSAGLPINQAGIGVGSYGQGYYQNRGSVWINAISSCGSPLDTHYNNMDIDWYFKRLTWWNRALNLSEVSSIYNRGMNAGTIQNGLIMDFKSNNDEGIVLCDFSSYNVTGNLYDNSLKYLGDANNCLTIVQGNWGFDSNEWINGGGVWQII